MSYSFETFPEGPERSSFSLATTSEAMEGPADFRVLADLSSGCDSDSLTLEGLSSPSKHWLRERFSVPGLWNRGGTLHDKIVGLEARLLPVIMIAPCH